MLTLSPTPPANWKAIARDAIQLPEFADATRHLGYKPFYVTRGGAAALGQIRDPLPALGVLGRAYVYPSGEDAAFLGDVLAAIAKRRIPFVRLGNTMWGVRDRASLALPGRRMSIVERHTPVLDDEKRVQRMSLVEDGAERKIRKAEKEGIEVRETAYDDEFVRGMTAIFNETPVRQGRSFWHYGKSFETVKQQFSRYIHREYMIGAYYQGQMIGCIMMGNAGRFGLTGTIISVVKHRDKATNNALMAKAVEVCAQRKLPYLCYLYWSDDSLAEFKRRCGFEQKRVPRYFVPLTTKGRLALKLGVHRGWKELLPPRVRSSLKGLRSRWYRREAAE